MVILWSATCAEEYDGFDDGHDSFEEKEVEPYHFGYEISDQRGKQHRYEHRERDGTVKGSYGFVDDKGVHREVHYVADEFGFRAQVVTNEKGTASDHPADVQLHSLYSPHKDVYVKDVEDHYRP
ncbi:hypothetical protein CDAR_409481 [Caerostris darwini]|uniref:Cuticle protein n=1 Tax=Caerostris darwini TaxID=1538125 RepID=A0AAV4S304_9ARAC|nr:hypothetical protein CDAR_409481 [Caerostris darwini]